MSHLKKKERHRCWENFRGNSQIYLGLLRHQKEIRIMLIKTPKAWHPLKSLYPPQNKFTKIRNCRNHRNSKGMFIINKGRWTLSKFKPKAEVLNNIKMFSKENNIKVQLKGWSRTILKYSISGAELVKQRTLKSMIQKADSWSTLISNKNPGKVVKVEENKRYLKKSEGKIVSNYLVHE